VLHGRRSASVPTKKTAVAAQRALPMVRASERDLEKFRLVLDFFEGRFVGIFQNLQPGIAQPVGVLLRLEQERHPVMIR
jgi:hypothetical protein